MAILSLHPCEGTGAALWVGGDGDPDPSGCYSVAGDYGGKPYYERADAAWAIWWAGTAWLISVAAGSWVGGWWYGSGIADVADTYTAADPYHGNPIVAAWTESIVSRHGTTYTRRGRQGTTMRTTGHVIAAHVSQLQRELRNKWGIGAKIWKWDLTEAERVAWAATHVKVRNRKAVNAEIRAIQLWMNTQIPLTAAGLSLSPPLRPALAYYTKDINLVSATSFIWKAVVQIKVAKDPGMLFHRTVMHVHEVPWQHQLGVFQWKYAKHIGSVNLNTTSIWPLFETQNHTFDIEFPYKVGMNYMIFVRMTYGKRHDVPVIEQPSHTDTLDPGVRECFVVDGEP